MTELIYERNKKKIIHVDKYKSEWIKILAI